MQINKDKTSQKIVNFTKNISFEDLPIETIKQAKNLIIDTLACIMAGSSAAGVKEVKEIFDNLGGNQQANIIGFDQKNSVVNSAFINSVMCHARDFDDTHDGSIHHGCVTLLPFLFALTQYLKINNKKISGKDFLLSLIIGLEVSNKIGLSFIKYLHTGWLPTTLWGPFGCIAAGAKIMNFSDEKILNGLGLAYSQINGNRQVLIDGVLAKRIQPAFATQASFNALFMAEKNIVGAQRVFEGDYSIANLFTNGKMDLENINELGKSYETEKISIKPYPSCRCTHPVIDAALSLKINPQFKLNKLSKLEIYLPPKSFGQIGQKFKIRENPQVDAQFSAQYTTALILIEGKISIVDFENINIFMRKDIEKLAKKITVIEHFKNEPSLTPIKMVAYLKGGETIEKQINQPKGNCLNPLSNEDLENKFFDCAKYSIKKYKTEELSSIIRMVKNIEKMKDMTVLIDLL